MEENKYAITALGPQVHSNIACFLFEPPMCSSARTFRVDWERVVLTGTVMWCMVPREP